MNASTVDRLSKIMEDLAGVVDEMTSASKADGAFALACAKVAAWREVENALMERANRDTKERNALLPVQQLPVEVLAGIFEMGLYNAYDVSAYYPQLKRLRTVCHLWQRVIDNSPWMWTRIRAYDPSRIVEEALKKSSNSLLDVYIGRSQLTSTRNTFTFTSAPPDFTPFLGRLDPHFDRLRSVEIIDDGYQTPESWFTGIKLLTTPQPSLERFSLRKDFFQANLPEITLFANQAPRLKSLELQGMRINCQAAILVGLSTLRLSKVTVPSLKALLGVVTRCGHLRDLRLKNISFQTVAPVDSPPEHVLLPFLRRLSLQEMSSTLKERFLRDVDAPQCADLAVVLQADAEHPQDLVTRYVPRWLSQRTPSLTEIARIAVEVAENAVHLYLYDSKHSECFRLFLPHDKSATISLATMTAVNTLLKAFAPNADTQLAFGRDALALAEDGNYRDQLCSLPQVTKLDIGEPWLASNGAYWGSKGAKKFKLPPFPGLQELCFYQPSAVGILKVVGMLRGASEAQGESCRFKVGIYVWEDWELASMGSIVEEVKGIVGEERIIIQLNPRAKWLQWLRWCENISTQA